jgi:hypothetical protein
MYQYPLAQRSQNRALTAFAALLIALAFLPVAPVREAAAVATSSVDFDDDIQRASAGGVRSIFPWTAIDANGNTHVVYHEQNNDRMVYVNNMNNGNWSSPFAIATSTGYGEPYLSHRGGILHVSYKRGNDIYYRRGTISGTNVSWETPQLIASDGKNFGGANWPDANGNVHFTWISDSCGEYNVFYRFRDGGGGLSGVQAPRSECGTFQTAPRITVTDDGRVHIVFQRDARGEIYHAVRSTGGSWSSVNISNSSTNSSNPFIVAGGNAVYAAWGEGIATGNHDVVFRRSVDGNTNSWSSIAQISNGPEFAQEPSLAYSAGSRRVYITWQDERGGAPGQPEIWFREYDPIANDFGEADRVANRGGASTLPIIAAGTNRFAITWQDRGSGEWEILRNGGTVKAVGCEVNQLVLNGGTAQTKNTTFGATVSARDCNPTRYQVSLNAQDENQPTATWTAGNGGTQGFNVTIPPGSIGLCTHTVHVRLFANVNNQEVAGEWTSATIKVDTSVDASVATLNPNMSGPTLAFTPFEATNRTKAGDIITNDAGSGASNGDPAFTRIPMYNLQVFPGNECTGLLNFTQGSSNGNIPATGYNNDLPLPTTPPALQEGQHPITVIVRDAVQNELPFNRSITYDPADLPSQTGVDQEGRPKLLAGTFTDDNASAPARLTIRRTLTFSGVNVTDNLYRPGNPGTQFWGVWVANEYLGKASNSANFPAPNPNNANLKWFPVRVASPASAFTLNNWSLFSGLGFGPDRTKDGVYRVYVRFLDGAGNYSNNSVGVTNGGSPIASGTFSATFTLDPGYQVPSIQLPWLRTP